MRTDSLCPGNCMDSPFCMDRPKSLVRQGAVPLSACPGNLVTPRIREVRASRGTVRDAAPGGARATISNLLFCLDCLDCLDWLLAGNDLGLSGQDTSVHAMPGQPSRLTDAWFNPGDNVAFNAQSTEYEPASPAVDQRDVILVTRLYDVARGAV